MTTTSKLGWPDKSEARTYLLTVVGICIDPLSFAHSMFNGGDEAADRETVAGALISCGDAVETSLHVLRHRKGSKAASPCWLCVGDG